MSELRFESSGQGIEKAHSHLQVAGSLVPFTVERPNRRQFSAEISDDVVLYLTGWTESEDSVKPVRQATAQQGMAAVTLYHPRYYNPTKVLRAAHLRVENVAAMVGALQDDFETVSLAGHSMGGIDAVRATHEHGLGVNVLAALGSAGLIKSDNFQHVAPRVLNEILQEEGSYFLQHPIHEGKFAFESVKTILRNPALIASEGIAAATHYVGRHIEGLAARGIVTANVMADGDKIFPYQDVLASTQDVPFDIVEIIEGAQHNFTYRRAREVAAFMIATIDDADAIRTTRSSSFRITAADVEQDLFGAVVS